MSQATLTAETRRHVAGVFANPAGDSLFKPRFSRSFSSSGAGILKVLGLPTFRSGTFRDSMGFQHTWEEIHIEDMARNFAMLRDRQLFQDVPVRDGHPGWIVSGMEGNGKVIGYHTGLSTEMRQAPHDLMNYNYLLGDLEIIDASAQDAVESGLWRSVSSEVGTYISNNEAEFWPVYQGVAYVDIPAVEGLKGFSKKSSSVSVITMDQGDIVGTKATQAGTAAHTAAAGDGTTTDGEPAGATGDGAEVPEGGTEGADEGLAGSTGTGDEPPEGAATEPPATGGQTTDTGEGQHSLLNEDGSFNFRRSGEVFGPVFKPGDILTPSLFQALQGMQAHTAVLEGVVEDTRTAERIAFVNSLVAGDKPKLLAAQKASTEKFALGLSADQYKEWRAVMDASAPLGLLQTQVDGTSNHSGTQTGDQAAQATEIDTLKGIVKYHKDGNMTVDKIKETKSYKRLLELEPTFTL